MLYLSILFILSVATVMSMLYSVKFINTKILIYFMKVAGLFLISAIIVGIIAGIIVSLF